MTDVEKLRLKFLLREGDYPMFSDDDLGSLLQQADGDVEAAAYYGLVMKSENTEIQVTGLTTPDTKAYFLRLASLHRPTNTGVLND